MRKRSPGKRCLSTCPAFALRLQGRGSRDHGLPPHYAAWLIPAAGQGEVSLVDLGNAEEIDAAVKSARKILEKAARTMQGRRIQAEKQLRERCTPQPNGAGAARRGTSGRPANWSSARTPRCGWCPGARCRWQTDVCDRKISDPLLVSGSHLIPQATGGRTETTNPVLFANPDYDLGPRKPRPRTRAVLRSAAPTDPLASSRGLGSLSSLPRVGRLPGTAEEAAAIKPSVTHYAKAEAMVYEDQYALEGVFKALHGPRVFVLSTHGFFLPDQEVEQKPTAPADWRPKMPAIATPR